METISNRKTASAIMEMRCPNPGSNLGQRLVAFIALRGHSSLVQAADASGISYQQLYDIITGRRTPRVDTLERIVRALGGSMHELYDPATWPGEFESCDEISA